MEALVIRISNVCREDPVTMTLELILCSIIIPLSVLLTTVAVNASCLKTIFQIFNYF
jgi:hypothetical protein